MNPAKYLSEKKERLEQALSFYLQGEDSPVLDAMRYSVLDGGKRFRPLLLLSSGEHFGAEESLLLPYACAVEFIHNYSLIHDDLPMMDNDDFRRGRLSCHKKYGEGLALLAGDGLLSLAFEILARAPAPAENHKIKDQVLSDIARAIGPAGMIGGQWLDISFSPENRNPADFEETALKKTAGLIKVSVSSGARLAGAPVTKVVALENYGTWLGLAFQLRDDLQDLTTDREKSFRPNLARLLGQEKALALLEEYLQKALHSLKTAGINSSVLEYFIAQLKLTQESKS